MVKNNEEKNIAEKIIAKVAYEMAKNNVNSTCAWFFYQPSVPEKLKKIKKY